MSKNKSKGSKSNDSGNVGTDSSVFLTVFGYCLLIILLPVFSFFASKKLFETLEFTQQNTNIYSAVSAVVWLHLALGLYLYRAFVLPAYSGDPADAKSGQSKQD